MPSSITLPAGEYLIVDPCYVMDDTEYQNMVDTIWGRNYIDENQYRINGKDMVVFGTKHGDGGYYNSFNDVEVLVDSGQIAVIPTSVISKEDLESHLDCGVLVTYTTSFECYNNDGILHFGHVSVDTAQEEDEEDEYWEDDEDEDEYEDEDD